MRATPATASARDEEALGRLVDLVRSFSGLEFPGNRRQGLERAVAGALTTHDLGGIRDLVRLLAAPSRRADLEAFTASLTIGETHFFRNAPQLEAIRAAVLPQLIAARGAERRLRIWSAGCSTGEEAYSLAMLVDALLPRRDGWDVLILATDINKAALDRARRGVYGEWSFRQVPEDVKRRYFARHDREYHLSDEIRDMVTFAYLNLVEESYPSSTSNTRAMDLILCRNVLIYFSEATINAVVGRLNEALAPGGWLVPGHAEAPMPVFRQLLAARDFPGTILYQRDASPAQVAPVRRSDPTASAPPRPAPSPVPTAPTVAAVRDAVPDEPIGDAVARWRAGGPDDALRMLQDLADRDPSDARPLHVAAKILASNLRLEPAEHIARLALQREPLAPPIHYLHGLILRELGRDGDALEALRRCVYLDPGFALGRYALASLLAANGQPVRADRELATTIELVRDRPPDEQIGDGDGVTYGRLLELAEVQRHLIAAEVL